MGVPKAGSSYGLAELRDAIEEIEEGRAEMAAEIFDLRKKNDALEYRIKLQEDFKGRIANRPKPKRIPPFPDALRRIGLLPPHERKKKKKTRKT